MILICAVDDTVAADVISELVDNDVTSEYSQDSRSERREHVWRLVNKYYTADVCVRALADRDERPPARTEHIDALVIHITEQELSGACGGVSVAGARAARGGGGAWCGAAVRCVLAECATEGAASALGDWCSAPPHALLVPRRERAPPSPDERTSFKEPHGLHCLRDALHAHTWPNLRRTDGVAAGAPEAAPSPGRQRLLVEQTHALAEALQAAGELRGAGDAARLQRAESVLLAVCRAAGLRLDELD